MVPVSRLFSRIAHKSGLSGSTSSSNGFQLMMRFAIRSPMLSVGLCDSDSSNANIIALNIFVNAIKFALLEAGPHGAAARTAGAETV
jgi:hypothetical protein